MSFATAFGRSIEAARSCEGVAVSQRRMVGPVEGEAVTGMLASAAVAPRLGRDAANSARALVEMTEAMQRRRGRGPQRIVVERIQVAPGGQAVAGAVAAGALSTPATEPMRALDVAPGLRIEQGEG